MDFIFANFTTLASYRVYENNFKSLILGYKLKTFEFSRQNIWKFNVDFWPENSNQIVNCCKMRLFFSDFQTLFIFSEF